MESEGVSRDLKGSRALALKKAEQGARANERIGHAACERKHFEMKLQTGNRDAARGAPAPLVAHL
jgi:hypothetical protein